MTRDELAVETQHLDLLDELAAAKAAGDKARLDAAKVAIQAFRAEWRGIRAYFGPKVGEGDGIAAPATVVRSAKTPKVGA